MKEAMLELSKDFYMSPIDYANQANAILGIREAGKTYTAMKAAEQLLDAGIPIIVYDPVGVWQNLKIGVGKHKGYSIVVAGGEGADIRLTTGNAVEIVRAAMKENVSLVIDLYSPELINKSTWIKVVQETVDLLMYENKAFGMRHIFLEEAAEFIPQRLQPQHSRVYASLERLARMGRNARLGMTIINQRAEEVNKAILEICAFSLLHKQVGKNSLKSIQQWLELLQVDNLPAILKSLPGLKPGECWAVGQSDQPHRIQVSPKNTYHPDPKKGVDPKTQKLAVDVSGFVSKMNKQLEKKAEKDPAKVSKAPVHDHGAEKAAAKIEELNRQLAEKTSELAKYKSLYATASLAIDHIVGISGKAQAKLSEDFTTLKFPVPGLRTTVQKSDVKVPNSSKGVHKNDKPVTNNGKLGKCSLAILEFLVTYMKPFTKAQIGVATGYSPGSGGFNNSLAELNTSGLIVRVDGRIAANEDVNYGEILGSPLLQREYDAHSFKEKLGKCEREIYEVLLSNPEKSFSKDDLADQTDTRYSAGSGGFNNSLARLNTLELIQRQNGQIKLNPELLELL